MATNKKQTASAAIAAALIAAASMLGLLHQAPRVQRSFPVTDPRSRGFEAPCKTDHFTEAAFFGLGEHEWNRGALLPLLAAIQTAKATQPFRPSTFSGSYACRLVRGSTDTWSHHAWALAVDFDAAKNCLGCEAQSSEIGQHPRFIAAFTRYGFTWGGTFSRPDPMHFEYDGPAVPVRPTIAPGSPDPNDVLCKALHAVGLPATCTDEVYAKKDVLSVVAFQAKNGLIRDNGKPLVEKVGVVGPATWTLLLLEAA